ncbi:hypothetical protein Sphch_2578 [Sphingobium chlorophenolicum L-1]|uniref:Uncharacterized protein n=1 Tax=Sphingobium chlorophenolicum L-1 TaxID=690566 RepID=F6EZP1_SPHCR|nr:hypothetical protein [Sphingobium chlorophenolicum]AEG50225.1 hypothetical protein Sphch_2578 [Sphingobium chlorophenolicum L-1]
MNKVSPKLLGGSIIAVCILIAAGIFLGLKASETVPPAEDAMNAGVVQNDEPAALEPTSSDAEVEGSDYIRQLPEEVEKLPTIESSCHMGLCTYFKLVSSKMVGGSVEGDLYAATTWDGETYDGNDAGYDPILKWSIQPQTKYIFCSRRLPAVMYSIPEGGFSFSTLDFVAGVPHVQAGELILYQNICNEGKTIGEQEEAVAAGYEALEDKLDNLPEHLNSPSDIFRIARDL